MSGTALFLINGLGMGNSTRCHAVIQCLIAEGVAVHVMTSGNGLTYFANVSGLAGVTPTESLFYSGTHGRISVPRTLLALPKLLSRAAAKHRCLDDLLADIRPDVAVLDSEYTVAPLRRRRVPIVALNNADVVVGQYLRQLRMMPRAIRAHFWAVEYLDYWFLKRHCAAVISPAPTPLPIRHPRIRRIGLIVRPAVRALAERPERQRDFLAPRDVRSLVMMLSGSIFASEFDAAQATFPFHVDVVGREGHSTDRVTFHGKIMDNLALLEHADALVINGGFSAVSEALALNVPTYVIPVSGHAEQHLNAGLVHALGRGIAVTDRTVVARVAGDLDANRWRDFAPRQPSLDLDGAPQAATVVLGYIRGTPGVAPGGRGR